MTEMTNINGEGVHCCGSMRRCVLDKWHNVAYFMPISRKGKYLLMILKRWIENDFWSQ